MITGKEAWVRRRVDDTVEELYVDGTILKVHDLKVVTNKYGSPYGDRQCG